MHRRGSHRVVDVQTVINELDGKDEHRATDQTDSHCTDGRYEVAPGRDAHEARQNAVQRQRERRFAILQPGHKHRGHTTCRRSEVGGQEDMRDGRAVHFAAGCQLRPWVESEPAHPEDEHTERCQREVVSRDGTAPAVLAVLAASWSQRHGSDERQNATHAVDDGRACKVVEHIAERRHHETVGSIVREPASAPRPVSLDGIDDERDEGAIDQIHRKLRALGHRTADDGGRGRAEDGFEDEKTLDRQVSLVETQVAPVGHPHKTAHDVLSEHQAETDKKEEQRTEHEVDKVLHQDVRGVLTAGESRLTEGKAWLHPKDQHGCKQHPYGIK